MNKSINLYPTPPAEWLWRDHQEDIKRVFEPSVTIPSTDEPLWHECTEADRLAYEEEWNATHPTEDTTADQAADAATQAPDTAEEGAGV